MWPKYKQTAVCTRDTGYDLKVMQFPSCELDFLKLASHGQMDGEKKKDWKKLIMERLICRVSQP